MKCFFRKNYITSFDTYSTRRTNVLQTCPLSITRCLFISRAATLAAFRVTGRTIAMRAMSSVPRPSSPTSSATRRLATWIALTSFPRGRPMATSTTSRSSTFPSGSTMSVAREFQDDVVDENTRAKLQFHEKWFWICNKNNKPLDAGEVDAAKKLWEQQQQIMQLQAQIAVMQQMGMMPMLQGFSHPYMPMGAAQLATQGFTSHPAEFPPLTTTAPALTRQTNMGGGCGCDDDSCKL